ncbi:9376_t:CDS:2, partial [Acaulospora colombiana]
MAEELCPDCIRGERLSGTPRGSMVETPALPAYFSPANGGDGVQKTSKVIVILPDVFGLKLVNVKLIADMLAKSTGTDVWVADIFKGNVWPVHALSEAKSNLTLFHYNTG